eukprot:TRINITY_DN9694_c0_g2_i2.p1 TRINITY_DN9694_c0_g2~~TRINITY_DN9694_c0_g2_i2.p1  ORF type:complete len:195 (-),score=32.78 TRINITY_DN9694_c0_g2_i2:205-789(-)
MSEKRLDKKQGQGSPQRQKRISTISLRRRRRKVPRFGGPDVKKTSNPLLRIPSSSNILILGNPQLQKYYKEDISADYKSMKLDPMLFDGDEDYCCREMNRKRQVLASDFSCQIALSDYCVHLNIVNNDADKDSLQLQNLAALEHRQAAEREEWILYRQELAHVSYFETTSQQARRRGGHNLTPLNLAEARLKKS